MSNPDGYFGTQRATTRTDPFNATDFIVRAILSGRAHVALVQVIAVTPGTPQSAGTVDVQPMVNQLDADGNSMPHGVINDIPWFTLQAGDSAVLLQPVVGDRGVCVFADRDISSVKSTREIGNPGSMRQCDFADGLYMGGFLNDDPLQWIKMNGDGIEIVSPLKVRVQAPSVVVDADALVNLNTPNATVSGNLSVGGGATGNFSTPQGTIVTVKDGIITNII